MIEGRVIAKFEMRVDTSRILQKSYPEVTQIVTPYATVRVSATGRKWSTPLGMVVDSGATLSVFPGSVCEQIGLNLRDGKYVKLRTAGGSKVPLWVHKVWLQVGETTLDGVYGGFRTGDTGQPLLGRLGVFDSFKVLVRTRARETLFLEEGGSTGTPGSNSETRVPTNSEPLLQYSGSAR